MVKSNFKLLIEPCIFQNFRQRKVQRKWDHPFPGHMAWSERSGEKVTSCKEGFKHTCIICFVCINTKKKKKRKGNCKINSSMLHCSFYLCVYRLVGPRNATPFFTGSRTSVITSGTAVRRQIIIRSSWYVTRTCRICHTNWYVILSKCHW